MWNRGGELERKCSMAVPLIGCERSESYESAADRRESNWIASFHGLTPVVAGG